MELHPTLGCTTTPSAKFEAGDARTWNPQAFEREFEQTRTKFIAIIQEALKFSTADLVGGIVDYYQDHTDFLTLVLRGTCEICQVVLTQNDGRSSFVGANTSWICVLREHRPFLV
jgi:hypothetical protein